MGSLFEDFEYPDNKKRGERASELAHDISTGLISLATQRTAIDKKLISADEAIRSVYGMLEADIPSVKIIDVNLGDSWEVQVGTYLEPYVVYKAAAYGLERASVAYLLSEGRIGEAALTKLVGLPKWFKFGKFTGGVAATLAVAAIVDAITGAVMREKLQTMIREQIEPRKSIQKAKLVNDMLDQSLGAITMTFNALKLLPFTPETLASALQSLLEQEKEKIASITDEEVATSLMLLDTNRGSWTKED